MGCTVGMVFTGKYHGKRRWSARIRRLKNTYLFLAVLSIMLYIDEDYKIKMADTARETTQEQIQKGEIGL